MPARINLDIRGRLRVKDTHNQNVDTVIQLVGKGYGNGRVVGKKQYQVRRHVHSPFNPQTPPQQANRMKFKDAVEAWKAMSEAERQGWRDKAKRLHRTGWNYFISSFLN